MSADKLLRSFIDCIDKTNYEIIENFINDASYDLICVIPSLTYDKYYEIIKKNWDNVIDSQKINDNCSIPFLNYVKLYNTARTVRNNLNDSLLDNAYEFMTDMVIQHMGDIHLDKNLGKSFNNFANYLQRQGMCFIYDILIFVTSKKMQKLGRSMTRDQLLSYIKTTHNDKINKFFTRKSDDISLNPHIEMISNQLSSMYNIDIGNELNRLIPDELASLKQFFIKTISHYYNNLHPIIWIQIIRAMLSDFLVNPPTTSEEFFQFISKHLLLNSGPFILKILQQIRPGLSEAQIKKYNLNKLTYPKMESEQYNILLKVNVPKMKFYVIEADKSASVGHVFIMRNIIDDERFVIKFVKPLAMIQSCWEYYSLNDLFPKDSCESDFIHNTLLATGQELYVPNEIDNIDKANKHYTTKYTDIFGSSNISEKLTTIIHLPDIVNSSCWYGFAMSLAPGIPLSSLIEGNSQLEKDTLFRSSLHRCLDMLYYKQILAMLTGSPYHGDLHAGNIFFSYEDRQMTLIDLGAVGKLNVFSKDIATKTLVKFIIMSVFYNYHDMLYVMTELVNSKCTENSVIDTESESYREFAKLLLRKSYVNIMNTQRIQNNTDKYTKYMFTNRRYDLEKKQNKIKNIVNVNIKTPYDYLDIAKNNDNTDFNIYDNDDIIDEQIELDNSFESSSFMEIVILITEFFAKNGINIAIKFSEFYELMKSYVLLMGVLSQTNYDTNRLNPILLSLMKDLKTITSSIKHPTILYDYYKLYKNEESKYNELVEKIKLFNDNNNLLPH